MRHAVAPLLLLALAIASLLAAQPAARPDGVIRETATTLANLRRQLQILRELGVRHVTIARLPTKIPQFAAVGRRRNPDGGASHRGEAAVRGDRGAPPGGAVRA